MEKCFHIHCVRSVYSEYKYGENRVEIDPSTVRSEKRESWYLEIIDLNMVTITPLSSQLGQWGAQIICLLSNQQLLIEKS